VKSLIALPLVLVATGFVCPASLQGASESRRFCAAVHALPESRRAACCAGTPVLGLAAACERELSRTARQGTVTLDATALEQCAAESAAAFAGCDWVTPYAPRLPTSCRAVVRGTVATGGRCRSSLECRDGLTCRGGGTNGVGLCTPPAAAGAACRGGPDALGALARQTADDGRHPECAGFCLRGRCVPAVAANGPCDADRECVAGHHCVAGRCTAGSAPGVGEPCTQTTCADGLVCADKRCTPPKKRGESCTQPFECEGACMTSAAGTPGVCGTKCSTWPFASNPKNSP